MKIKSARRIAPELSRCIEVDAPDRLFAAGGADGQSILSHNSVVQRNIVFGCILRPDSWRFLGIDLKKVELSVYRAYSNVVLGIATELEDALTVLRFAQQTMMRRYGELEQLGLNNFLDLPNKGQALMVMVDEAGELLGSSGVKALSASTYIPNLNNRNNIREIRIGDIIFDNHGNQTTVLDKYEPMRQEQFDLTIANTQSVNSGKLDKEIIRTGADHYWVVYCPDDEHSEPHTLMTRQLFEELKKTDPGKTWKIKKLANGINSPQRELSVAPDELGTHLAGEDTLSEADLISIGINPEFLNIPSEYLYSSAAQRMELLKGFYRSGDFITDDLYMVQDLQRLIASLGFDAKLEEIDGKIRVSYQKRESDFFEIESLKPVPFDEDTDEEMYCLRVDSPDSQFLCSENFITTHNTDEGKEQDMLKGEASMIIGSIARLGRAAGVHLVIATQRPDATLIPGETKANLGVRLNCGRTDPNASSMILGNGEGSRVKANPRGRLYLSIYGRGDHGQGFFAPQTWIDEYLASQGMNPDGSPLSQKQSRLAKVTDFGSEFGEDTDLDSKEGIDNSSVIDQIREEEASGNHTEDDDDWGFLDDDNDEVESTPSESRADDGWGDLELGNKRKDNARPEDDWDDELENLIGENFN